MEDTSTISPPINQGDGLKTFHSKHMLLLHDLTLNGLTVQQAASKHGFTPERVYALRQTSLWKREQRRIEDDILRGHRNKLENLIPDAIETLKESMKQGYDHEYDIYNDAGELVPMRKHITNPPSTRANAATVVLDRCGLGMKSEKDVARSIVIQLFKPPWNGESKEGKIIDVEVHD